MHPAAIAWVRETVADIGPGRVVIEVGSRNINGSVRGFFRGAPIYIGIDLVAGPGVDLIADGAFFAPLVRPDRVVCCEVLEHTERAGQIIANAWAELTDGGWLIVTAANEARAPHSAVDGGALRAGEFYRGVSRAILHGWLATAADLTGAKAVDLQIEEDDAAGDIRLVAQKQWA